jgi:hypothetical protein
VANGYQQPAPPLEPPFRPVLSKEQALQTIEQYKRFPSMFRMDYLDMLEKHAEEYDIPFARNEVDNESKIGRAVSQLGSGFLSGFTTFEQGDPPKDEWEGIARNIGHLAGFVGYIPATPFKLLKLQKLSNAALKLRGRSVPLTISKAVTEKAGKIASKAIDGAVGARAAASGDALKFLQSPITKDIVEGAFNLGIASAVGAWQGGVDEMMRGFIGGVETGAVFRGIGNLVQTGSAAGDKVLRGLASSMYTGLPSTVRGDTTPEQVYNYLLGAYFGVMEMPYHRRMGQQFLNKMAKHQRKFIGKAEPEMVPGWEDLPGKSKDFVVRESEKRWGEEGEANAIAYELTKNQGMSPEEAQKSARNYLRTREKMDEYGELRRGYSEVERDIVEKTFTQGGEENLFGETDLEEVKSQGLAIKIQGYVDRDLKKVWSKAKNPNAEKIRVYLDVDRKWTKLVDEARKTGGDSPDGEMTQWLSKKYGLMATENDYNFWRRYGKERMAQLPIRMLTVTMDTAEKQQYLRALPASGNNDAGNMKRLYEPMRLNNSNYQDSYARRHNGEMDTESPSLTLNHVVEYLGKGKYPSESHLINYKENLIEYWRTQRKNVGEGYKRWNEFNARNFKWLDKRGYYYEGGSGDKQRQDYMKYHPDMQGKSKELLKIIGKSYPKKAKFSKMYKQGKDEYVKAYKGILGEARAKRMYDKAYVSNVLYTLQANGVELPLNSKKQLVLTQKMVKSILPSASNRVISSAKAYNKRAQIWKTSGIPHDPKFFKEDPVYKIRDLAEDDSFRFGLIHDVEGLGGKQDKLTIDSKAREYLESEDGGVIGRPDVVKGLNREQGLPVEGGIHKSFIVSPSPQYGALLGKYAVHTASPELAIYMKKKGMHFLINTSSAKQSGSRTFYKIARDKDGKIEMQDLKGNPVDESVLYKLPIQDMKTVTSDITDLHFLDPQRVPKQMQSVLTPFSSFPIFRESISDMYETLSGRGREGDPEVNKKMDVFLANPKGNQTIIEDLVRDIDKISIDRLVKGIKEDTVFASNAYRKMMRVNDDIIHEMVGEGELTRENLLDEKVDAVEFNAIHERIIRFSKDSLAGAFHKYSNDYREAVVRNYVVHRFTRPLIDNSATGRMRPYDIGLWNRTKRRGPTKELNDNDNIFFLDNTFKELKIRTDMFGREREFITLGDLWEKYHKGQISETNRPAVEEIFNAVLMRVPMDNISGAHVLKFSGFTGIDGLGVLIHPRTVKALGGADLDGDKSWIFFGDEAHGFKKSWKDMYDKNKGEFFNKEANNIASAEDAKAKWRSKLTGTGNKKQDELLRKMNNSSVLMFSPWMRQFASEGSAEGRTKLGTNVVGRTTIAAAHAATADLEKRTIRVKTPTGKQMFIRAPKGTYVWEEEFWLGKGRNKKPKKFRIHMKAKTSKKEMDNFRELARAAVSFSSDPMDESGLRPRKVFSDAMVDSLFDFTVHGMKGEQWKGLKVKQGMKGRGITRMFSGVNTALYGRDFTNNRRWTRPEIMHRLGIVGNENNFRFNNDNIPLWFPGVPESSRNTLLGKIARDVENVDWSDSVFHRVDKTKMDAMYSIHEKNLSRYDWLKNVLLRKSMAVPQHDYIKTIWDKRLFTDDGFDAQLNPKHEDYDKNIFDKFPIYRKKYKSEVYDVMKKNYTQRKRWLLDMQRKAEHYLINDISDMASMKVIMEAAIPIGNRERILEIHRQTEAYKSEHKNFTSNQRPDYEKMYNMVEEEWAKNWLIETEKALTKDVQSNKHSQNVMDVAIGTYRSGLNVAERNLFDMFLLGSLNRGKVDIIEKQMRKIKPGKMTNDMRDQIHKWTLESAGTSTSRLGFMTSMVPDASVRKFIKSYSDFFDMNIKGLNKKATDDLVEEAKDAGKKQRMFDEDGKPVEGSIIESSDFDVETKKYINEHSPFEGLYKGKLNRDARKVLSSLEDHINYYRPGITGRRLNGLVRTVIGKNLNAMTLEDFRILDRWFTQMRTGTWYQRMFAKLDDKTGFVKLAKRHYMNFPETVNLDIMRGEMKLVKGRGMFLDQRGNAMSGEVYRPTNMVEELMQWHGKAQEHATGTHQEEVVKLADKLDPYVYALEDGVKLFDVAVIQMDNRYANKYITAQHKGRDIFKYYMGNYKDAMRRVYKTTNWNELQNKKYVVREAGEAKTVTGKEVVRKIQKVIEAQNKEVITWLQGDGIAANKYIGLDDGTHSGLERLRDTYMRDRAKEATDGKKLDMNIGMDGLREIGKRIMVFQVPNRGLDHLIRDRMGKKASSFDRMTSDEKEQQRQLQRNIMIEKYAMEPTGQIDPDMYWPHVMFDRKVAEKELSRAIKIVAADKSYDSVDREKTLKKLVYHHKQVTGDWIQRSEDMGGSWDIIHNVMNEIAKGKVKSVEELKAFNVNRRVGNQFSRTVHVPGWNTSPEAYDMYMKNILNAFYSQGADIVARDAIVGFRKVWGRRLGPELANSWANWFQMYSNEAQGGPSVVPDRLLNDPTMKIKGTPYAWWADNRILKKLNNMKRLLGFDKKRPDLPKELIENDWNSLRRLGQLEAKYELATLLAHIKSSTANMYGGSVHTWINVGAEHFKNARDIKYMQTINKEWKSKGDLYDWVKGHGIVEEFLLYEGLSGLTPGAKSARWRSFVKEGVAKIAKDPNLSDVTLREIARKHKISDSIFNKAAAFMRIPERILRRDAFISHYLAAVERFGGMIGDYNHPLLIEMAKKGVKATQFLYSAPYRPAFARTQFGKVYTRFQLWSWNSVRFRKDIINQAHIYGWREGTQEFEKYKRMATADLFMLGLANVFMYSIFENALPAPWNWFQDTAEMMFGDDNERERAFFGAYPAPLQPLQMITPPLARLLPATFKAMVTDDYTRLSNYYIWTMFPFGRMARDIAGPGGILENPMRSVEKLTGLPYMQLHRAIVEEREKPKIAPRGFI